MGCNSNSELKSVPGELEPVQKEVSFLALGDSYTIGESVEESSRWPVKLTEELRGKGYKMQDPQIIARTGWTTENLLSAMEEQLTGEEQYDLVSVLIGVNNQYQGKSPDAYEQDLNEIFRQAIHFSVEGEEGVFAVSIPDYGVTPFGASNAEEIAKEIDEFNAIFEKVAGEYNIDFYNITPVSKRAKEEPDLTADDGLHPSGKMYGLWVEKFIEEVAGKLEQ
ncbi:lysophospholipase [Salinimicrobium marinum]|uniref:Lysophospholipase n=2 Tax=Salinimicrobium marinum TaxID=680283 RepID=A0A918SI12_9FLAO|nr:lysophospholipase [Salinimicrobium marinum]